MLDITWINVRIYFTHMKIAKLNIDDKVYFVSCTTNGLYNVEYGEAFGLGILHTTYQYELDVDSEELYDVGIANIGVFTTAKNAENAITKFFDNIINSHLQQIHSYESCKNEAIKELLKNSR